MKSFFAPLTRCHIILLLALIDCIMKNGAVLDGVHNIGLMFLKRKQLMALHICGVFLCTFPCPSLKDFLKLKDFFVCLLKIFLVVVAFFVFK